MKLSKLWMLAATIVFTLAIGANAQNRGGSNRPRPGGGNNGTNNGGGGGGTRGNFDPAEFRQRMDERMKEELAASDEEWKKLQPKIEKIRTLQRETNMDFGGRGNWGRGGFGGGFGGGGNGGPDNATATTRPGSGDRPVDPVEQARQALRDALRDTNTPPEDIAKKLQTFRDARDKVRKDLADAQADLKASSTPWQEARLVSMGLLD